MIKLDFVFSFNFKEANSPLFSENRVRRSDALLGIEVWWYHIQGVHITRSTIDMGKLDLQDGGKQDLYIVNRHKCDLENS